MTLGLDEMTVLLWIRVSAERLNSNLFFIHHPLGGVLSALPSTTPGTRWMELPAYSTATNTFQAGQSPLAPTHPTNVPQCLTGMTLLLI